MLRTLALLVAFLSGPAHSQHQHGSMMPSETGQSAFAALAEIVALLRSDSSIDWNRVDIPALRAHLLDMDALVQSVEAERIDAAVDDGVTFSLTGDAEAVAVIHRMVPAHMPFLEAETGWQTEVELTDTGALLTVIGDEVIIAALGFHGLMTIGAHHQEHHMAMALGGMPH